MDKVSNSGSNNSKTKAGANAPDTDSKTKNTGADGNKNNVKIVLKQKEKYFIIIILLALLIIVTLLFSSLASRANPNTVKGCESKLLNQDQCLENLAASEANASICRLLPNSSVQGCYLNIANKTKNISYCGLVNTSSTAYQNCVYSFTNASNSNICLSNSNATLRSECASKLELISNQTDEKYCSYLLGDANKSLCYNEYYFKSAIYDNVPEYCSYLPDNTSVPLSNLLEMLPLNKSADYNLEGDSLYLDQNHIVNDRSLCYVSLFELTNNRSLCSDIPSSLSYLCSYNVTTPTLINSTEINETCADVPSLLHSVCISEEYYNLANETKNYSYCRYVTNATLKSKCNEIK